MNKGFGRLKSNCECGKHCNIETIEIRVGSRREPNQVEEESSF